MGEVATIAIAVSGGTVSYGDNRKSGLNVEAWTDNLEHVYVSSKGVRRKSDVILGINDDDLSNYTISGSTYTTSATWVAAFNNMIEGAGATGDTSTIVVNTNYPDTVIGDKLTISTTKAKVLNVAKSGNITVKADSDNTDSIWLGGSAVADEDGYLLAGGDEITYELSDISTLYIIGGAASQTFYISGSYKA